MSSQRAALASHAYNSNDESSSSGGAPARREDDDDVDGFVGGVGGGGDVGVGFVGNDGDGVCRGRCW